MLAHRRFDRVLAAIAAQRLHLSAIGRIGQFGQAGFGSDEYETQLLTQYVQGIEQFVVAINRHLGVE